MYATPDPRPGELIDVSGYRGRDNAWEVHYRPLPPTPPTVTVRLDTPATVKLSYINGNWHVDVSPAPTPAPE